MKSRTIVEIGGLISIIGSLIFVGIEISQNTAAVRGATQQEVSNQVNEMYKLMIENDFISDMYNKAYQGVRRNEISDLEMTKFSMFQMMGFRRIENIHLQYKNGFLGGEAFDRIGMGIYRTPLVKEIWEIRKYDFEPEFVTFFEKLRDGEE